MKDGKIKQKSQFECELSQTIITAIKEGEYNLNEMALLWLYCQSWGKHAEHVLSQNGFWKFNRDNLRQILFDLSFQDPDEDRSSNELMLLLKAKLQKENKDLNEWCDLIYKRSIETIPKRKFIHHLIHLSKSLIFIFRKTKPDNNQ